MFFVSSSFCHFRFIQWVIFLIYSSFATSWSDLVVIKISQCTCNLAVPSFRNLNLVKICLLQSLLIYRWIGFVWSIMIALCFPLRVKRDFEEDFYQVEEGIWLSGRLFKCWIIVKEKSFATYYKKMINKIIIEIYGSL